MADFCKMNTASLRYQRHVGMYTIVDNSDDPKVGPVFFPSAFWVKWSVTPNP